MEKSTLEILLAYTLAGVAVAAWSVSRAANNEPVWQGLGSSGATPAAGTIETVALWPLAVIHIMGAPKQQPTTPTANG